MKTPRNQMRAPALPYVTVTDFEGPFDVLLDLARARKIDISRVSLQQITDDFLTYVQTNLIPSEQQLDFLIITCTLLLLKVQRALPELTPEEEAEVSDLTDRLRMYQLYRAAAQAIRTRWQAAALQAGPVRPSHINFCDLSLEPTDLQHDLDLLLQKNKITQRGTQHLRPRLGHTLKHCIHLLRRRIAEVSCLQLDDLSRLAGPQSMALSLLAVLELAKKGECVAIQEGIFAPIIISSA